jgi:multicomponent Na+:H+ antiporter subunit D
LIDQHLPILQIIIPLIAAPFCVMLRSGAVAWLLAATASWLAVGNSWLLLQKVMQQGVVVYELGGWEPPYGIEYRVDSLNGLVIFLISCISAIVITYAKVSVDKEVREHRQSLFYTAWLLCITGLLGIAITGDAFNVFVFLEISSLSTYALVALGGDRRALTAAYRYLVMGTIGATFILIGIGLMYMQTGTLNMADLADRLHRVHPGLANNHTINAAFAFLTVGISLKLALFPLHRWLPNAYTFAPSAVSAFLAATATKVSLYLLLRFSFTIFGIEFAFATMGLDLILMVLSLFAICFASLLAVYKVNVKRMLAYSSVAQIGYMTLGISFGTVAGISAGILHMFNHALMKGCLFMALGCVFYRIGSVQIDKFSGLAKRMPLTMAAFVVGGLSIIGIPLTAGFISKWYLISAALEQGKWAVAIVVLAGSLIAAVYIWKVVEKAYFGEPLEEHAGVLDAPPAMLIPMYVLVFANLYFGVQASLPAGVAEQAAKLLIRGGP